MKNSIGITLGTLIFGAALVLSSCATTQTGTERSEEASNTMQMVEQDIRVTVIDINAAGRALASLISPAQQDMTTAFDDFSNSIDALVASRNIYFEQSEVMGVQGRDYFEEWRVENTTYENPNIASLSVERREKLGLVYADIATTSLGLKGMFNDHVEKLQDIRTFFSTDLTPGAARAITPVALSAISDGFTLNIELEKVLSSISAIRYELSGIEYPNGTYTGYESGAFTTTEDVNVTPHVGAGNTADATTIQLAATGNDNQMTSDWVEVGSTTAANGILEYTTILYSTQSNTSPSALDTSNNVRYTFGVGDRGYDQAAEYKANIDIVYYFGVLNSATLAAPADGSLDGTGMNPLDLTNDWDPKNVTLFGPSFINFDNVEDDSDISNIRGLSSTRATTLQVGNVIAFELSDGKKGLIKVTELTTGDNGSITLHVKMQA